MPALNGPDPLTATLTQALAELTRQRLLLVADISSAGVTVWEIRRDENGFARARRHAKQAPSAALDVSFGGMARASENATVVLVRTAEDDPPTTRTFDPLSEVWPQVTTLSRPGASVPRTLREVIAGEPLTVDHTLITVHADPSGRLALGTLVLFPAGARGGTLTRFNVRCNSADSRGTVFAMVIWTSEGPRLLSLDSARLGVGRHGIVAELARPGRVRFRGEAEFTKDDRPWPELLDALPSVLPPAPPHLICAVEVSGAKERVMTRLARLEAVVRAAAPAAPSVSVISYGPHSFERRVPDAPISVLAWRAAPDAALTAVRELRAQEPLPLGYPLAAPIECVLHEVVRRLTPRDGPSALLTIGDRPAHPHRVSATEVLPCPNRIAWKTELARLPAPALVAICDHATDEATPIWNVLGADHRTTLDSPDLTGILTATALDSPALYVPFPLIEVE